MLVCDIVDTRTGVLQSPVFPSSGHWDRALNDVGSGSHVFPNAIPTATRASMRDLFRLWARTLVVSTYLDAFGTVKKALYAGLIVAREFDGDTGMYTIHHADIRSLLSRRYTFGTNGYSGDTSDNKLALINMNLPAMVPWVVWAGTVGPTANYDLPIVTASGLPLNSIGGDQSGTESRTYYDYNFTSIDTALTELHDVGPDIDFEPRWTASGTLEWVIRTGTTTQLQIVGETYDWNMTVPEPGLIGVKVKEDGVKQSTVSFAVGLGSEVDMQVATTRIDSDLPALEQSMSYKGANQGPAVLQDHANADLATFSAPTEQWSFSMLLQSGPEKITLGAVYRLYFRDHGWIEDGWHSLRIIGFSNDMSQKVSFSVQPIGGI